MHWEELAANGFSKTSMTMILACSDDAVEKDLARLYAVHRPTDPPPTITMVLRESGSGMVLDVVVSRHLRM